MKPFSSAVLVTIAAAALTPTTATAAVTIDINQVGSNVVATGSGSLDLSGLTLENNSVQSNESIRGSIGYVGLGAHSTNLTGYSGLTGPALFGPGSLIASSTSTGTTFALNGSAFGSPYVFVPFGYTSGTAISDTATWAGQSLASLGLTVGQYVYTSRNDSVTVNIGVTSGVPEPSTWALMLLGFGAVGWAMRRKPAGVASHRVA